MLAAAGRDKGRPVSFACQLWSGPTGRDPVLRVAPSESAQAKKASKQTNEGFPVHSFATLLAELGTRARVTYTLKTDESSPMFQQVPDPNPLQARAYELISLLPVAGN